VQQRLPLIAMLKMARKYPILFTCAVVAAVSLFAAVFGMAFSESGAAWMILAFTVFSAACSLATLVLSYNVFGGRPNSSIHGPGASRDDRPR
jgi:hypothetical protein